MSLDKDTLRTLDNYLSRIAILIAPGMVILELVFHRGLLSANIHDIPELILLIIWSLILSAPYYFLMTYTLLWFATPIEQIETGSRLNAERDDYEEALPLTLLLVLITVGVYKITIWLDWPHVSTYFGIRREYVLCVVSVGVTMIVSVPLAAIYYWIWDFLLTLAASQKVKKTKRGQ